MLLPAPNAGRIVSALIAQTPRRFLVVRDLFIAEGFLLASARPKSADGSLAKEDRNIPSIIPKGEQNRDPRKA